MSKKIKPKEKKFNINFEYNDEVTASCACGTTFKTGSTNKNIRVDICATCHPFFTGEKKFVDSEGRVEKFKKKYEKFNK